MVARGSHPDFLDLPWHLPLVEWETERLTQVTRGIHRHVVRFVNYDGRLYALKELAQDLAEREYRLLRYLAEEDIPVVTAVGVVTGRQASRRDEGGGDLEAVLITRHLDFSLPYRALFTGGWATTLRPHLLDAMVELLVRLHLINVFWGDCSLSNTLFRRDAGALAAYLVDAETGEARPSLSDGMRAFDLDIAELNVAGELLDIAASGQLSAGLDAFEIARDIRSRYEALWDELRRDEVFAKHDRYRIEARLRRLNELGYDVDEFEIQTVEEGEKLRLKTQVVEPGHHRRRLYALTGLDVQENQARRLLRDLDSYRPWIKGETGVSLSDQAAARRWMGEIFEPTLAAIPPESVAKLEPAEIFHQVLEHRWFLSEREQRDVSLEETIQSYTESVLATTPNERTLLDLVDDEPDEPSDLLDTVDPY